ncbi:MAG: hypothetical protein IKW83_08480 [Muribaculaceae bacterium]|nr:hypothetical protein [Muribaculaceae bacterium]
MDANKTAKLILALIFPLVFNLLFLLLNDVKAITTTQWLSYAFLHVAYLVLFLPALLNKNVNTEKTLSWTLFGIATTYFVIELMVAFCFLFIFKAEAYYESALILQVILLAIAIAIILVSYLVNNNTKQHLDEQAAARRQRELQQKDKQ